MSDEVYGNILDEAVVLENDAKVAAASENTAAISSSNTENIEPAKEEPKSPQKQRKSSFPIRLGFGIILALLAVCFIRPNKNSDAFYYVYFILFIAFTAGVFFCCCLAEKSVSALHMFFTDMHGNKWRYSSMKSEKKEINDICDAYKKSFLISGDEDYHKTRANSDLYFGSETWLQDMNVLPHSLDSAFSEHSSVLLED